MPGTTDAVKGERSLPAATEDMLEKTFNMTVIFSVFSRCDMIDPNGGLLSNEVKPGAHIAHIRVKEENTFNKNTKQDKVIYIDCSDLEIDPSIVTNPKYDGLMSKLTKAIEIIKGFLDQMTAKGQKGKVNFNLCGYAPAEVLMYALDSILSQQSKAPKMYGNFIANSANKKFHNTFTRYLEGGFSFKVVYKCIYAGYSLATPALPPLYERIRKLEILKEKVRRQQQTYHLYNRDLDEWNYMAAKEKEKGGVEGVDYPSQDQVEYNGRFCTEEELEEVLSRLRAEQNEIISAQEEYNRLPTETKESLKMIDRQRANADLHKKNEAEIKELEDHMARLKQQGVKNTEQGRAYEQGRILHEEEGKLNDYHSIDKIEYQSEYCSYGELMVRWDELQTQLEQSDKDAVKAERDGIRAIYKEKEKLVLKYLHLAAGIGSLVFGPLALVDALIEVYEMVSDGDPSHLFAIGINIVAVFPIAGGTAKILSKGAQEGKTVNQARFVGRGADNIAREEKKIELLHSDIKATENVMSVQEKQVSSLLDKKHSSWQQTRNDFSSENVKAQIRAKERYEASINVYTRMERNLDKLRNEVYKEENKLSRMIYRENIKSKIALYQYYRDIVNFQHNIPNLTKTAKITAASSLLKDGAANLYTVYGVVDNGYFIYKN